jgi:hypothetical protein
MGRQFLFLVSAVALVSICCVGNAREWTDASKKFKVEGDFVAVRAGKVILEKADGSIIGVPLEKLCQADQDFAKAQQAALAAPGNPPAMVNPPAADNEIEQPVAAPPSLATGDKADRARSVQKVLRENCYRCHGEGGSSEGGVNFIQNLAKIAGTLVKPGNATGSLIYQRVSAADDGVMPPPGEAKRPSATEIALIKTWIEEGSPVPAQEQSREFISNEQIMKLVLADVQKSGERSRRFLRYFSLTHLYNAGVSDDELQTYRNAFTKLINSLSWNTSIVIPRHLDPEKTIFSIDMRDLSWTSSMWEQIEASSPYFLPVNSGDLDLACEATQSKLPCVRVDWFVFAASKPPLYHVMLGLPESAAELESLLRINVEANIDQEKAIRAGFNRSGVSQNNRLIEWHKSPYGSYWKSYDFGSNIGRQNLFEYPLGPGNGTNRFQHDGGELIFTLPNGLQGYLLVTGDGKRIDRGPTNIVSDPKSADKTVINGVSCMSCHFAGVVSKSDEVGPAVSAHRKAFADADVILSLYREPAELAAILDADAKHFAAAMQKVGVNNLSRSGEPISVMSRRFEQELDSRLASCEFGLSIEQFFEKLDASDLMSRRFAALRNPGGVIKRDVFAAGFVEATAELKLAGNTRGNLPAKTAPPAANSAKRPSEVAKGAGKSRSRSSEKSEPVEGEVCRFTDLGWGVKSVAFSPNGMLAAGMADRKLYLFDIAQQSQIGLRDRLELLGSIDRSCFTPSGNKLLLGGSKGPIVILEVSKEGMLKEVAQFAGHPSEVTCIALSGDGKLALSGSHEKKVRLWEVETGKELETVGDFQGAIKACYLSKDGRTGMATDGATLIEWSFSGKTQVKKNRPLAQSWASGQSAAISADGGLVAVGDSKGIRIWNLKTTKEFPTLECPDIQWSMTFTHDGTRLLSGGSGVVNVWDVHKSRRVKLQAVPEGGYIQTLAVSPDGKQMAATGRLGAVYVFRVPAVQ